MWSFTKQGHSDSVETKSSKPGFTGEKCETVYMIHVHAIYVHVKTA